MCGRYAFFTDRELREIDEIIEQISDDIQRDKLKTGEIFPTNVAPVYVPDHEIVKPRLMTWGFPNFRNKGVIINARAETVGEKNLFRSSLMMRRCIIPSTGFYEWDADKKKFIFNTQGDQMLYMAGIFNQFKGENRFVILTTDANASMAKVHDRMPVVVPTGNFGNILAAYYAGRMGLPINRYICASNENNILTDFINTGVYDLNRAFYLTNSPSMDILISSNLERLLYHLSGNDGDLVRDLMERMEKDKVYEVTPAMRLGMASFFGGFADMEATGETIGNMYKEHGYLMDTHTAVAYRVYQDYREQTGDTMPTLIAATASAYKFADSVADAIGIGRGDDGFASVQAIAAATGVPIPSGLLGLEDKPILHNNVVKAIHMDDAVKTALSRR